jgi:HAD superfamily hydrolase (TIGR01509 family)
VKEQNPVGEIRGSNSSFSSNMIQKMTRLPSAVLFDMDGTLTEPMLDFPRIKREMGIGQQPILEALAAMEGARRDEAEAILHAHEDRAAHASVLNDGCMDLLRWLSERKIATALITRNSRKSMETVLRLHRLNFGVVISREDAPIKPSPAALSQACSRLGVAPADALMVGDGQYDVEAGAAAGIRTIWLSHGKPRPFVAEPWETVNDLLELTRELKAIGR